MHDLSIMDYVLGERPVAVSATGVGHVPGQPENIAYLTLFFDGHADRARPRQLAGAGEGPADADRRQPQDDRLRRPRAEREDQGLRQGHHAEATTPRERLPDAGRLPHRRHVGAAARRRPRRCAWSASISSNASSSGTTPLTDGRAGLRVVQHPRGRDRSRCAERGRVDRARRQHGCGIDDSVSSISRRSTTASRPRSTRPSPRILDSAQFVLGPEVAAFEQEFAAYCGAAARRRRQLRHQRAAPGAARRRRRPRRRGDHGADHVRRHVAAICYAGARPVFVDIDPTTLTMDPGADRGGDHAADARRSCRSTSTASRPTWIRSSTIARRHGLSVIEDAAQAHGAEYKGTPRRQHRRSRLLQLLSRQEPRRVRRGRRGRHQRRRASPRRSACCATGARSDATTTRCTGFNYRMDGVPGRDPARQAAPPRSVDRGAPRGTRAAYDAAAGRRRRRPPGADGRCAATCITSTPCAPRDRDELQARAARRPGSQTGIHYPIPVHLQQAYADLGYQAGDFPHVGAAAREVLSLPMFPEMTGARRSDAGRRPRSSAASCERHGWLLEHGDRSLTRRKRVLVTGGAGLDRLAHRRSARQRRVPPRSSSSTTWSAAAARTSPTRSRRGRVDHRRGRHPRPRRSSARSMRGHRHRLPPGGHPHHPVRRGAAPGAWRSWSTARSTCSKRRVQAQRREGRRRLLGVGLRHGRGVSDDRSATTPTTTARSTARPSCSTKGCCAASTTCTGSTTSRFATSTSTGRAWTSTAPTPRC